MTAPIDRNLVERAALEAFARPVKEHARSRARGVADSIMCDGSPLASELRACEPLVEFARSRLYMPESVRVMARESTTWTVLVWTTEFAAEVAVIIDEQRPALSLVAS